MRNLSVLCFFFLFFSSSLQAENNKNILFLHSYNTDYKWTRDIDRGFKDSFVSGHEEYSIYTEFMDTKHYSPELIEDMFLDYLIEKYKNTYFSLILVSDDNALEFIIKNRKKLFPYNPMMPVIFSGINNTERHINRDNITGIAEKVDISGTIELILHILPFTDTITVITDTTPTGKLNRELFINQSRLYETRVNFILLDNETIESLQKKLSNLPNNSAVIYLTFLRDAEGKQLSLNQSIHMVVETSKRPVFTCWDSFIIEGAVGGRVLTGYLVGKELAMLVEKFINGKAIKDIEVIKEPLSRSVVDFYMVKKYGIPINRIPEDTEIINLPRTFFYEYPNIFFAVLVTVLVLATLIILLIISNRKKAATEKLFRTLFEMLPEAALVYDSSGTIQLHNDIALEIADSNINNVHKNGLKSFLNISTAETRALLEEQIREKESVFERIIENITGRAFEIYSTAINYEGKEAILALIRDITERKKAERRLAMAVEEKDMLLREIHHRVKNNLQIINSLIQLQKNKDIPAQAKQELEQIQSRLAAMAIVYELLQQKKQNNRINLDSYLSTLVSQIKQSLGTQTANIEWIIFAEPITAGTGVVIPLGLILSELITNSIKHNQKAIESSFKIEISLSREEHEILLLYSDQGSKIDMQSIENNKNTLGIMLIKELVRQLNGTVGYSYEEGKNNFTIRFTAL
ncbi:ABC transporter substrate binding protein [Spirochaetia bacterium 38H-sp]|uniref:histidine kinase n=1 Tax=Rarispira pelagica TaxID=3141764 RepID=A0ABU9UC83_9SPIR